MPRRPPLTHHDAILQGAEVEPTEARPGLPGMEMQMTSKVVGRLKTWLAQEEIWRYPAEIVLVHHDRYTFNGCTVEDMVSIIQADADEVEYLDNGPEDAPGEPADPADLMGDSFNLHISELRAFAQLLLDAADAVDAIAAERAKQEDA